MSNLNSIFLNFDESLEGLSDGELSEISAAVLAERQSRGGRGPETRLSSMIHLAALDYHRHDCEVKQFAKHLAEHTDRVAKTGTAGGAIREYGNDGARLDEAITSRSAAWERWRALVYVRDDEFPEGVPSDE